MKLRYLVAPSLIAALCFPAAAIFAKGQVAEKALPCSGNSSYPVHLTFDDGPKLPETEQILNTLKKEGVKATFFVSSSHFPDLLKGKSSAKENELIALLRRMQKEGHTIGSHSFDHIEHANPTSASLADAKENLRKNKIIFAKLGLEPPTPFRFPYGSGWFESNTPANQAQADLMMRQIKSEGFLPTHWDVDTWDWSKFKRKALPESLLRQICSHQGGVALLHDVHSFTAQNLPAIIRSIKKSGHHFMPLKSMIAHNKSLPAEKKYTSFADRAAGLFSCSRPIGDLDQVWPSCRKYNSSSADIVNPVSNRSAQ